MEIESCEYNWDEGTIDVIYQNGKKISLLCEKIEFQLDTAIVTSSKLEWLKENNMKFYAELAISGKIQEYLNKYESSYYEEKKAIRRGLEKNYDKSIANAITNEMMMYRDET